MIITVVGLGKIGLPLAVQYSTKGHRVVGVDIDARVVRSVNNGVAPFPGEPGLEDLLRAHVGNGDLSASVDVSEAVKGSDAVVVAVPLSLGHDNLPDFTSMDVATRAIGRALRPGALVSFETTVPVGTTRGRLLPVLERESGLRVGDDFFVVFSPERVLTGRVFEDLRRYPKLLGGVDEESTRRGQQFYEGVLDFDDRPDLPRQNGVWIMSSCEAAELAKLAETTYRDVNIALANQFALFSENHGIRLPEIIEACNSQPYSHIHRPGVSVGGHCIPVYPHLYLASDPGASLIATARELNLQMPLRAIGRIEAFFGPLEGVAIHILGVAYRGGVKETAFSGVFPLVAGLENRGASVTVEDPLFSDDEIMALGLTPAGDSASPEIVIVHTDHSQYATWSPSSHPSVKLVYDGGGILDAHAWPSETSLLRIGVPDDPSS